MHIPLNKEQDIVKKKPKAPPTYMIPVFIGIGYANPKELQLVCPRLLTFTNPQLLYSIFHPMLYPVPHQ